MPLISYCDNSNCQLNKEYQCSAESVEFDDSATCITARYEDDELYPHEEKPEKPKPQKEIAPESEKEPDDWIKYI